jgi:hypothetical protein
MLKHGAPQDEVSFGATFASVRNINALRVCFFLAALATTASAEERRRKQSSAFSLPWIASQELAMTLRGPRGMRFAAIADLHGNLRHLNSFPYPQQRDGDTLVGFRRLVHKAAGSLVIRNTRRSC